MKKKLLNISVVFTIITFSSIVAQTSSYVFEFTRSIEQEKKLDYTGAITTMKGIADTTAYEVNVRIGWLYYKAGYIEKSTFLYNKSIEYYNKAILAKPKAIEPRYGFGLPAYLLEDHTDLINQDLKILELDPNNKTINGNLGSIYYYRQEYIKALPHLEKVISQYPFDYDNNLLLGWTYLKLDSIAKAEECFNTVLFYNPNDASAYEGINSISTRVKPISETVMAAFIKDHQLSQFADNLGSIAVLNEVYDKDSYIINARIARLNFLATQYAEAEKYYKIAAQLKPFAVEPKLGLASVYEALNNTEGSRATYQDILKIDEQNTIVQYKLGMLDYDKKDYTAAITHFEKVINLYPTNGDGLLMLGWANYYLNKTPESKSYFNRVLCFAPDNASAIKGLSLKPLDQIPKKHTGF